MTSQTKLATLATLEQEKGFLEGRLNMLKMVRQQPRRCTPGSICELRHGIPVAQTILCCAQVLSTRDAQLEWLRAVEASGGAIELANGITVHVGVRCPTPLVMH
jgi:hypothetical protein